MSKEGKHSKSIIIRLLVLFLASYMMITLIGLFRELKDSQNELTTLRNKLKQEQLEIEKYRSKLDGPRADIIEKAARERLGYVYSDEEVYIDISGN